MAQDESEDQSESVDSEEQEQKRNFLIQTLSLLPAKEAVKEQKMPAGLQDIFK